MSADHRAFFLLDIVEGECVCSRRGFEVLAANFQTRAVNRDGDIESCNRHRLAGHVDTMAQVITPTFLIP